MSEAIAHYTVLEDGVPDGIGRFVRARDTRVGRTVGVRILTGRDAASSQQFLQDARLAAKISHPNVAATYDVGEWDGAPYIACEFVTGEPLRAAIGGRRMNQRRAVDIAAQIADALAEAQAAGIVHADLTVDNVVMTPRGHVKLVNVGITRWSDAPGSALPDRHPAEPGSDMRVLGAILVEMLTGQPPVKGDVLRLSGAPESARKLSAIVAKLQAARGPEAAQMAAVMAAELRAFAASIDDAHEDLDTPPFAASEPRRASRLVWLLVGAAVIAAIGGLLWLAMRSS